jgi:hypothetical protein
MNHRIDAMRVAGKTPVDVTKTIKDIFWADTDRVP